MIRSHLTSFGLPGLTTVPYGVHLCHVYSCRDELAQALVPYFQAGLEANERCVWVAADPLPAKEIRHQVSSNPLFGAALRAGQLTIVDSKQWYGPPNRMTAEEVIQKWLSEEDRALDAGFDGLRITGNTSFLTRDQWNAFMQYEEAFHAVLRGRRLVVCCSYPHQQCQPVDLLEIVQRHHGALTRVENSPNQWEVLGLEKAQIAGVPKIG